MYIVVVVTDGSSGFGL